MEGEDKGGRKRERKKERGGRERKWGEQEVVCQPVGEMYEGGREGAVLVKTYMGSRTLIFIEGKRRRSKGLGRREGKDG